MDLISPIQLSDRDRLETLRRLDQFRQWRSLDEKRYCLVCSKIITGRQIQVIGGTRGTGPLRIICPTECCNSIPMDWVLPTNEVPAKMTIPESERSYVPAPHVRHATRIGSTASFWHKFALHFKRPA
jgi:hypothetical protein